MAKRTKDNLLIKYTEPSIDKQSGPAWFDASVTLGTLFDSSLIFTPPADGRNVDSLGVVTQEVAVLKEVSKTTASDIAGLQTNTVAKVVTKTAAGDIVGLQTNTVAKVVTKTAASDIAGLQANTVAKSVTQAVVSGTPVAQSAIATTSGTRSVFQTGTSKQEVIGASSKDSSVTSGVQALQSSSALFATFRGSEQAVSSTQSSSSAKSGIVSVEQTANALQSSVVLVENTRDISQSATALSATVNVIIEPPVVDETGIKGVGGRKTRKLQKVVHNHLSYEQRKQLDDKIYDLVLEEVLGIVPAKDKAVEITKEIVKDIPKTDVVQASKLNEAFLQETARLQAWLIVEELKRKAEEDDEQALLALI